MSDESDGENPFDENQLQVLRLLVKGKSVKEISEELKLPYETVSSRVDRMISLAGARKTPELTYMAGWYRWCENLLPAPVPPKAG